MFTTTDHRIAALASQQHGVVTRAQLRAIGLSDSAVSERMARGRLHRVHRGVFGVGHLALGPRGRWMAAVLASGSGAVLDLRDAAQLHGVARRAWKRRRPTVAILTSRQRRPVSGISRRVSRHLPPHHVTKVDGIPVVTLDRLVLNLAARESATTICKLLDEIAFVGSLDLDRLRGVIDELRNAGPAHATVVDAVSAYASGERGTDSELEEMALELCAEAGVPLPACNVWITHRDGRCRVDQCWKAERVILEVDGVGHLRPTRRRIDRRRRATLRADGWTVLVVTRHHLTDPKARARATRRLQRALHVDTA